MYEGYKPIHRQGHQAPEGLCQHCAPGSPVCPAFHPGQVARLDTRPSGSQSHLWACFCCYAEVPSRKVTPMSGVSFCLFSVLDLAFVYGLRRCKPYADCCVHQPSEAVPSSVWTHIEKPQGQSQNILKTPRSRRQESHCSTWLRFSSLPFLR